jgi:dihydroorotate dehydrogenase (NAD+) catalytic subunit
MAGATAVQVGTANFINPGTMLEIIEGLDAFLKQRGLKNIREIIGSAKL